MQGAVGPGTPVTKVHPIVDEGLGNSSYLVEVAERRALVVDPSWDPRPYLQAAAVRPGSPSDTATASRP